MQSTPTASLGFRSDTTMEDESKSGPDGLGIKTADSNEVRRKQKQRSSLLVQWPEESSVGKGYGASSIDMLQRYSSPVLMSKEVIPKSPEVYGDKCQHQHIIPYDLSPMSPKSNTIEDQQPAVNMVSLPNVSKPSSPTSRAKNITYTHTSIPYQPIKTGSALVDKKKLQERLTHLVGTLEKEFNVDQSREDEGPPNVWNRTTNKGKSWSSHFKAQGPSKNMKMDHYPELYQPKDDVIELHDECMHDGRWNNVLIGHFLDGRMDYALLRATAREVWKDIKIVSIKQVSSCFFFEFEDEDTKNRILEGGPYHFSNRYLVLREWSRMMKPTANHPPSIPVWVKIRNLPFECWTAEAISRITSTFGKPLHVDNATASMQRLDYARVCVEINASLELPRILHIRANEEEVSVSFDFQKMPSVCKECKVFGHTCKPKISIPSTSNTSKSSFKEEWQVVGKINKSKVTDPPRVPVGMDQGNTELEEVGHTDHSRTQIGNGLNEDPGRIEGSSGSHLQGPDMRKQNDTKLKSKVTSTVLTKEGEHVDTPESVPKTFAEGMDGQIVYINENSAEVEDLLDKGQSPPSGNPASLEVPGTPAAKAKGSSPSTRDSYSTASNSQKKKSKGKAKASSKGKF